MRSILVFSASGLVLFSRHFTSAPPPTLLGALLRGISELSERTLGALSFIEYSSICVSIARGGTRAGGPGVFVALIFDRDLRANTTSLYRRANQVFGGLLAKLILRAFLEEYGADLAASQYGHALSQYKLFATKAFSCVRDAVKLCVQQLATGGRFSGGDLLLPSAEFEGPGLRPVPSIEAIYLLGDEGLTETWVSPSTAPLVGPQAAEAAVPIVGTGSTTTTNAAGPPGGGGGPGGVPASAPTAAAPAAMAAGGGSDQLLLLLSSNVRPLLDAMGACLSLYGDVLHQASMTMGSSRILLYRLGEATLTLQVRTEVGEDDVQRSSEVLLAVLQRLLGLFLRLKRGLGGGGGSNITTASGTAAATISGSGGSGGVGAIWPSLLVASVGSSSTSAAAAADGSAASGPLEALVGPSAMAAATGYSDPDFVDVNVGAGGGVVGSGGGGR
jgi:hypothetical protein